MKVRTSSQRQQVCVLENFAFGTGWLLDPLDSQEQTEVSNDVRAEVWIYDVLGEEKLGAKAFRAEAKNIREILHTR